MPIARKRSFSACVTLIFLLMLPRIVSAHQQGVVRRAIESVPVSAEDRAQLIGLLEQRIAEVYAFPDRVDDIRVFLDDKLTSGSYDDLSDGMEFGRSLTDDLRAFTGDNHFAILYDPVRFDQIQRMRLGPNPSLRRWDAPDDDDSGPFELMLSDARSEELRRANYFMPEIRILDGNVGYLKIDQMPPLGLAQATVDAAMEFLGNSDALIIDLRSTPGGVGGFIPYVMSWLFPMPDMHLFSRSFPFAGRVDSFYTAASVPGRRLEKQPVYVLTNTGTGSAAENLAYTLRHHGRATIVGEATAGAANSASVAQLTPGFVAQLPIARVIHPVTGTNWDDKGVQPDVETSSSSALDVAHIMALETLADRSDDTVWKTTVMDTAEMLRTKTRKETRAAEDRDDTLAEYEGTYGERILSVIDGQIRYQRPGGPQVPLARIEGDLFQFELAPNQVSPTPLPNIRFDRDAAGHIVSISGVLPDGGVQNTWLKVK